VERQVPADTDRTWAELLVVLLADRIGVRDVLELEARALAHREQPNVDPARGAHHLPGQIECLRRLAARDGAAGVADELIAAADLQVALDRQEPAAKALGRGDRLPQILDGGVVRPDRDCNQRALAEVLAIRHAPDLGAEDGVGHAA
jgi:hypothetical protein